MDKPSTSKAPQASPISPDAVRISDSDIKEDAERLDSQLEDCAKKYNLSCLNVKNIIFHIIKDPRTFSSLLTEDPDAAENLRITRSRLKELEVKAKTRLNIELKPMNPVRTFADVDFGDDDADPDYQPDENEIDDDLLDDENWFEETEDEQSVHDLAQTPSSIAGLDDQQFLSTVDPDYADFVKRCATPHQIEYDEEDEDDDEYNYNELGDPDEPDEYRMDRSTKVTFRELNALIEDAVPEDARVEIFPPQRKKLRTSNPQLTVQTQRAPSAAEATPSLIVPLATPPLICTEKIGEGSPPREPSAKAPRRSLNLLPLVLANSAKNSPVQRTTTSWSLLRRHQEPAQFTDMEVRTLRVQFEKHVQLLTQSVVATTGVKELVSVRNRGIDCLTKLDELMYNSPESSIFRVRNLDDAIASCHEAESYDATRYSQTISLDAQSAVTTLGWRWEPAMVLAHSRALLYPELVPQQRPLINQTPYAGFLAAEQELLALALYELRHVPHGTGGTGRTALSKYQAIVNYFLPCKTTSQIRNFINNVRHGAQKTRHHRMIMAALNGEFNESLFPLDDKSSPYRKGERPVDWPVGKPELMQRSVRGLPLGALPVRPSSETPPLPISLTTMMNGQPVDLAPGASFSLVARADGTLELVPTAPAVVVIEADRLSEFSAFSSDQVPPIGDEIDIEGFSGFSPNSTPNPIGDLADSPALVDLVSPSPPFTPPHSSSAPPIGQSERGIMKRAGRSTAHNSPLVTSMSASATPRPSIVSRRKTSHQLSRNDPEDQIVIPNSPTHRFQTFRIVPDSPEHPAEKQNPKPVEVSPDENLPVTSSNMNVGSSMTSSRRSDPQPPEHKRTILIDRPPSKRTKILRSSDSSKSLNLPKSTTTNSNSVPKPVLRPVAPRCIPMKSPAKHLAKSPAKTVKTTEASKKPTSSRQSSAGRSPFVAMKAPKVAPVKPTGGKRPISSDESDAEEPLNSAALLGDISDTDAEMEDGELVEQERSDRMGQSAEMKQRLEERSEANRLANSRAEAAQSNVKSGEKSPKTPNCVQQEADSSANSNDSPKNDPEPTNQSHHHSDEVEPPEDGELSTGEGEMAEDISSEEGEVEGDEEADADVTGDSEDATMEEAVVADEDTIEEEEVIPDEAANEELMPDDSVSEELIPDDEANEDEVVPDDGNEIPEDEGEVIPDDFVDEEMAETESLPDGSTSPSQSRSRPDSLGDEPFVDVTVEWNESAAEWTQSEANNAVFQSDDTAEEPSQAKTQHRGQQSPPNTENLRRWQPLLYQTVMNFARKRLFMHDGKYRTFKSIAGNAEKSAERKYDEIHRLLRDTPELADCFGALLRDEDLRPDQRRNPERAAYRCALEMMINIHVYFSAQPNSNVKRRLLKIVCDCCLDERRLRDEMRSLLAGRHDSLWNYLRRFLRAERCTELFDERRAEHIPLQLYTAFHASFAASAGQPQRLAALRDALQREHLDLTHLRWDPDDFRPSLRLHNGCVHGRADDGDFAALNIETTEREDRPVDVEPPEPTAFKPTDDNVLWALFEAKRDFAATVRSFVTAFVGSFNIEQTKTRLGQLINERKMNADQRNKSREERRSNEEPTLDGVFVRPRLPAAHRRSRQS